MQRRVRRKKGISQSVYRCPPLTGDGDTLSPSCRFLLLCLLLCLRSENYHRFREPEMSELQGVVSTEVTPLFYNFWTLEFRMHLGCSEVRL